MTFTQTMLSIGLEAVSFMFQVSNQLLSLKVQNVYNIRSPSSSFVQVLHVCNNHWLTVNNLHCDTNTVKVYNSLNRRLEISDKFGYQLAALWNFTSFQVNIKVVKVQREEGIIISWFVYCCFCTRLCAGIRLETQNFVQKETRSPLAS